MQKAYLLFILLLSIKSIYSYIDSNIVQCDGPANASESLKKDCSNGVVSASVDNIGNVPDSCCRVYLYDRYSDEYGLWFDEKEYCLQMKKSSASDYINYIKKSTSVDPDYISITCGNESVLEWDRFSSAFFPYIRTFNFWILFLFLLF